MAKIQLKSDNINPFGGLFSIFNQFDRSGLRQVINEHLGRRGATKAAFTHGDVFASMFGSYLCGGDCIEDVMDIKPFWDKHESIRVCSSDVILRTLRNHACENVSYESDRKKAYAFNVNEKMNSLLLKCLAATGQLTPGDCVNLDFDHQFIAADKKDAKYSYKKADGYFPGVASIGGLIVGVENRETEALHALVRHRAGQEDQIRTAQRAQPLHQATNLSGTCLLRLQMMVISSVNCRPGHPWRSRRIERT